MSIDQKQNILTKSSEDERVQLEVLRGSIAETETETESHHNTGSGTTSVETATTTTPSSKTITSNHL